ncbi:FGGY-family carbohydrate kinase, partial [uncultured Enorma sp.]|uniref:FGGY-family carbohydrate kinase n=1 Tax=uncultured Enorma sp. TaxID=1714346 RepID=UPI0028061100
VAPATHDTGSAWLAVPAQDERSVYLSSGTWSLMGCELGAPVLTEASMHANFTNEGGAFGTVRYLKNIMGLWMAQRVREELAEVEGSRPSFDELVRRAREAEGFEAVIDVDDPRFLAPQSMTEAVRAVCVESNQSVPTTSGELMRCIYRSLAVCYAHSVRELSRLTGVDYARINIVGGGCQNAYLNELTAAACGMPVFTGPVEGTALGNIMIQLIAAGEVPGLAAARALVRRSFDIKEVRP